MSSTSRLCPICPGRAKRSAHRPVLANGPRPCRIMFIGEGPARDEDRRGRPFVGRSGREFNEQYLPLAGLVRAEVFVTNAMQCSLPRYDNPTHEQARVCGEHHLPAEIEEVRPEIIVPMGAVACSLFGDQIDLGVQHGIPMPADLYQWSGIVFPTYHPAIGLHEGSWMQILRQDFTALGEMLSQMDGDGPAWRLDEYPEPVYEEVTGQDQLLYKLRDECAANPGLITIDTEVHSFIGREPYCFSFSRRPGSGAVIFMDRPEIVKGFCDWMAVRDPLTVFHNYLFDLPVCEAIGIPIRRYDDTMVRAYNLQDLPRGLKALAYRLCGMRMDSFDDVVVPYSKEVVRGWLAESMAMLYDATFTSLSKPNKRYSEGRPLKKPRKMAGVTTTQARTLTKLGKLLNDLDSADPWERWDGWHDYDRELLGGINGPIPGKSIVHCPRDVATRYSAADADATMRILGPLKHRAAELRHMVTVA